MSSYLKLQMIRFQTLSAYRQGTWKNIPIIENGELLVEIPPEYCFAYYHHQMRLTTDTRVMVRESVLEAFLMARETLLPFGYHLMAYDGWRPITLQHSLFWYYMLKYTVPSFGAAYESFFRGLDPENANDIQKHFYGDGQSLVGISPDAQVCLMQANQQYVSFPSRDPAKPSPHYTGGSLDVWPHDASGQPVSLGVPFDYMEEEAGAFYHLKKSRKRFPGDKKVIHARTQLVLAMDKAGFSTYGPEIWHFNFGNQMDALVKGGHAQYGCIEP